MRVDSPWAPSARPELGARDGDVRLEGVPEREPERGVHQRRDARGVAGGGRAVLDRGVLRGGVITLGAMRSKLREGSVHPDVERLCSAAALGTHIDRWLFAAHACGKKSPYAMKPRRPRYARKNHCVTFIARSNTRNPSPKTHPSILPNMVNRAPALAARADLKVPSGESSENRASSSNDARLRTGRASRFVSARARARPPRARARRS